MNPAGFLRLAAQTVIAPREVARLLLSLRLSHEALLTAFALVVTVNALVIGGLQLAAPEEASLLFVLSPLVVAAMLAAMMAASILFLTGVGRLLGGAARPEDVAILLIWAQAVRALAQVAVALLSPLSSSLASLLVIAVLLGGIWILVHFLDEAHGFGSLLKALLVLVLGGVALVFALSFLFTLAGITPDAMAL